MHRWSMEKENGVRVMHRHAAGEKWNGSVAAAVFGLLPLVTSEKTKQEAVCRIWHEHVFVSKQAQNHFIIEFWCIPDQ